MTPQPQATPDVSASGTRVDPRTVQGVTEPMYRALLALSDTIDADEGPVILAWGVTQLAAALTKALADRGWVLTDANPTTPVIVAPTSLDLPAPVTEARKEWGVRYGVSMFGDLLEVWRDTEEDRDEVVTLRRREGYDVETATRTVNTTDWTEVPTEEEQDR